MKKYIPIIIILLVVAVLIVDYSISRRRQKVDTAPTINQILNAKIPNFASNEDETVSLNNGEIIGVYKSDGIGHWVMSLEKDFVLTGDFNGDGKRDIAAVLFAGGGGSGMFYYLLIFENDNGEQKYVASQYLGDRIKIKGITYKNDIFSVDMITQGPDEGYCCGTLRKTFQYKFDKGVMSEIST